MIKDFIKFEDAVFGAWLICDNIITEYDRNVLMSQYSCCTHNIEFTGHGFYDNIVVDHNCTKLSDNYSPLGNIYVEFRETHVGLGMAVFTNDGFINLIEFYCYDEVWDGNILDYNIYEVKKDGSLVFFRSIDVD